MGKSNRVRAERAAEVTKAPAKKSKEKRTSRIYSVIIAAVALFVLTVIVISVVAGVSKAIYRNAEAMESENYAITGNMFRYLVKSEYESFLNQYSSYLSYFSLNRNKPLADQQYGTGSETAFLGEFEGTWLEYFVEPAREQAKQILIYCEEADARSITLDDDDKKSIDDAVAAIESELLKQGHTFETYYGNSMKQKDVRSIIELSTLAAKAAEALDEEIVNAITAEEIKTKYENNTDKYDVVDYLNYSIKVSFNDIAAEEIDGYDGKSELTDAQKETVLPAYEKAIKEAKAKAEGFKAYTDAEQFLLAALNDTAGKSFDKLYKSEALATADALSKDDLAALKAAMIKEVIEEAREEAAEPSDDTVEDNGKFSAYGIAITKNAATSVDNIKKKLFSSVASANELYGTQKANRQDKDDFSDWAFADVRNVGDRTVISVGDGSKGDDIKNETGTFSTTIYFLEATRRPDTTLSKDVAYMAFDTRDAAIAAIDAIGAGEKPTLSSFEAVAKEKGAVANGLFEDYVEGQLSYNGFEEWLYDDETLVGSYTLTPLANATENATEYAVFFYVENGEELWALDVKSDIFVENYQEKYKELEETHSITVDDIVIDKVEI